MKRKSLWVVPASRLPDGEATPRSQDPLSEAACALIASRQNVPPKCLVEPGPSRAKFDRLLLAAAAAPDHGQLLPWRFVVVPQAKRDLLAEVFALALIDRDPGATLLQIETAREKAHRAPLLMLAAVRLVSEQESEIPDVERIVSLGCAIQNVLLAATAMGFGSGLTSGQAMTSDRMRTLFRLGPTSRLSASSTSARPPKHKPGRIRPTPGQVASFL